MTHELEARPGRPRDVGVLGPSRWFVDHDDGTVSFIVRRSADSGVRHGLEHAFHAGTDEEALAEYERWSCEQYEQAAGRARRREKWGPLGKGKMT